MSTTIPLQFRIGFFVGDFVDKALRVRRVLAFAAVPLLLVSLKHFGTDCNGLVRTATLDLKAIANGAELYERERGHAPASLAELVPAYVEEVHLDPWGHAYRFSRDQAGTIFSSAGPDGLFETRDDVNVINAAAADVTRLTAEKEGIRVGTLAADSWLRQFGVRENDLVVSVNGKAATSSLDLYDVPQSWPVAFVVRRHGQLFSEVTLHPEARP